MPIVTAKLIHSCDSVVYGHDPDSAGFRPVNSLRIGGVMAVDGGWGWMVVVGSCICNFFSIGIQRSFGVIFVLLQERFEASATDTAMVASVKGFSFAFGGAVHAHMLYIARCDRTYDTYVIFPITYVRYAYVILPYVDLIM